MKFYLTLVFFWFTYLSFSQVGTYKYESELKTQHSTFVGHYSEILQLYKDGTFKIHMRRHVHPDMEQEYKHGKGSWTLHKEKLIYFKSEEKDSTTTSNTINLNNSKARWIKKSVRDKSNRTIPEALRFYKSNTSWIIGRTLTKE